MTNNRSAIHALKLARRRIEYQWNSYICAALPYNEFGFAMRDLIHTRLNPHDTISSWLRAQGFNLTQDELRLYRLQWIDLLIEELPHLPRLIWRQHT
jgi:hypothetical protein